MDKTLTQGERIYALEIEVAGLREDVKALRQDMKELLDLKNKGAGAFWLVTFVVGSGLAGVIYTLIGWFHK